MTKIEDGILVWQKMDGNPSLLTGITVGEFSDLMETVGQVLTDGAAKAVPLGLVIQWSKVAQTPDLEVQMDTVCEILAVPLVRAGLNKLAGLP